MAAPILNEYKLQFTLHRLLTTVLGGLYKRVPEDTESSITIIAIFLRLVYFFLPWLLSIPFTLAHFNNHSKKALPISYILSYAVTTFIIFQSVLLLQYIFNKVKCNKKIKVFPKSKEQGSFDEDKIEKEFLTKKVQSSNLLASELDDSPLQEYFDVIEFVFPFTYKERNKTLIMLLVLKVLFFVSFLTSCLIYLDLTNLHERMLSNGGKIWSIYFIGWFIVCMSVWPLLCSSVPEPNTYLADNNNPLKDFSKVFYIAIFLICFAFENQFLGLTTLNNNLYVVFLFLPLLWNFGILPEFSILFVAVIEWVNMNIFSGIPLELTHKRFFIQLIFNISCGISVNLMEFIPKYLKYNNLLLKVILSVILGSVSSNSLIYDKFYFDLLKFTSADSAAIKFYKINEEKSDQLNNYWKLIVFVSYKSMFSSLIVFLTFLYSTSFSIETDTTHTNNFVAGYILLSLTASSILITNLQKNLTFFGFIKNNEKILSSTTLEKILNNLHKFTNLALPLVSIVYFSLVSFKLEEKKSESLSVDLDYFVIFENILIFRFYKSVFHGFQKNKKERRKNWILYVILNIILLPCTLVFVVTSSVLNAPLVPLFTLPLFIMGFPRPTKQWPITSLEYKGSLEWSIYRSFLPEILLQLELNIKKFNFKEGKYFLIRIEDYLVLFKVTEVWNDVIKLQFRCLETQGTSCHNLEVAKIDDYFDFAFNNYKIENKSRYFNSHIFHILQPVTALNLNVYSKSEGVFAGVLDTPNTLRLLQPTFFKVLVWFLLEKLDINILVKFANNIPLSQEIIKLYWEKFPLKWLLHLKATKGITLTKYAEESLILIAISIYCCVFNSSIYDDPVMSSDQIYTSYKGKLISYNLELKDWLKKHLILWKFSLKAFRYTTKIVYEQFVLNDLNNYEDVLAKIEDCDRNWLITVELNSLSGKESRDLHENFLKKHLSVYMLGQKKEDKSLFFRIFKITKTQGYVGELNGEVIKSIWANLNFELLYLANDDDERYSIQAHELLLRNLITQAADPPLGYPVYTVPAQISNEAGNYI